MPDIKNNSEKFDALITAVMERLVDTKYPGGFIFDIPGTDNEADCQVIHSALDNMDFCFQIGVHRNGNDMLVSNFWKYGSEEHLRAYFREAAVDDAESKRIRAALEKLSRSVDDKMD